MSTWGWPCPGTPAVPGLCWAAGGPLVPTGMVMHNPITGGCGVWCPGGAGDLARECRGAGLGTPIAWGACPSSPSAPSVPRALHGEDLPAQGAAQPEWGQE